MKQSFVKIIGIKDISRKDSYLMSFNEVYGLKSILDRDFEDWSNFDSWERISVQQSIFSIALEVYRGKKIDIQCDCCEHNEFFLSDFVTIKNEKCNGKKIFYIIAKIVDEIVLAKTRRESDGTYYA